MSINFESADWPLYPYVEFERPYPSLDLRERILCAYTNNDKWGFQGLKSIISVIKQRPHSDYLLYSPKDLKPRHNNYKSILKFLVPNISPRCIEGILIVVDSSIDPKKESEKTGLPLTVFSIRNQAYELHGFYLLEKGS